MITTEELKAMLSDDDRKILTAYADAGMKPRTASKVVHYCECVVHRKLTNIYRKTGIDPRAFRELAILIDAIERGGEGNDSR